MATADANKAKSGMESMLRSLGLGDVLDAANQLAQSGAINEVIQFAQAVGPIRAQLDRIERNQIRLLNHAGLTPYSDAANGGLGDAPGIEFNGQSRNNGALPGAGSSDDECSNSVSGGQGFERQTN